MVDLKQAGLKFGIEIHQRLDTHKLFCQCSPVLAEVDPKFKFFRNLRAIFGELGEVDPAALFEFTRGRTFNYQAFDQRTCLVEMDEEPPQPLNQEAMEIALGVATMLSCKSPDEVFIMRKTVIDGSNTSGFQRTAIVGLDGKLEYEGGTVDIPTVCLEEESAGIVASQSSEVVYALDRLGIPLVEIATGVMEGDPKQAKVVAEKLGLLLRATGKVQRGIGTIRQDINVSVKEGRRIEIKGVQMLDLIQTYIENEARRQLSLVSIQKELTRRGGKPAGEVKFFDVTDAFKGTASKLVAGKQVWAVSIPGFSGIFRQELYPGRTFGKEVAEVAGVEAGVKGVLHTDELPAYGITDSEVEKVRKVVKSERGDIVVMVFGDKQTGEKALKSVVKRCAMAYGGVPKETRKALPDGGTGYMRPLPGAARMYPETDSPPFLIDKSLLERVKKNLPEPPDISINKLAKTGISPQIAREIFLSGRTSLYCEAIKHVAPTLAASILVETTQYLKREGIDVDSLPDEKLKGLFWALGKKKLAKEIVPQVLIQMAKNPSVDLEKIISELGITGMSEKGLEELVDKVVEQKLDYVKQNGERAASGLMGLVMAEAKGRVDGRLVNQALQKKIKSVLGGG